jgi:hypothetical protein
MLQVDVENNRVLFCAEGIPLYDPLLGEHERSKKKSVAWGCLLLSVATFSTVAMILVYAMYPSDLDRDSLSSNGTNSTAATFSFAVKGKLVDNGSSAQFEAMEWMNGQREGPSAILERFALASLFVATSGHQWNTFSEFINKDTSVCEWNDGHSGVFCDDNHSVTMLLLGEYKHRT